MISLEIAGRVDVRVGTGVRRARTQHSAPRPAAKPTGRRATAVRRRSTCCRRAASSRARSAPRRPTRSAPRASPTADTLVARMRKFADDAKRRDAADRAFHVAIAAATGNSTLTLTVEDLWDQRHGDLWTKLEQHFHTPTLRKKTARRPRGHPGGAHRARRRRRADRDAPAPRPRVAEEFQRGIDRRPEINGRRTPAERPDAHPLARRVARPPATRREIRQQTRGVFPQARRDAARDVSPPEESPR